ncbi:MAG: transposase [Bryobacteraceae bacterium]
MTPHEPLPEVMRWLKWTIARRANVVLKRTGEIFWQDESYDHWIRNRDELSNVIHYIEGNPVSAGLCEAVEGWPWSSAQQAGDPDCVKRLKTGLLQRTASR